MERKSLEFAKSKLEELSRYVENLWKGFRVGLRAWNLPVGTRVMQVSRERKRMIDPTILFNHGVKEMVLNYHACFCQEKNVFGKFS